MKSHRHPVGDGGAKGQTNNQRTHKIPAALARRYNNPDDFNRATAQLLLKQARDGSLDLKVIGALLLGVGPEP